MSAARFDNIPPELRALDQWGVYRREADNTQPYQARSPRELLSKTTPGQFGTFDEARAVVELGKADGLAFVTTDSKWSYVDMDGCFIDGELHPSARAVVDRVDSYAERSKSGEGIHVLAEGKVPGTSAKGKLGHPVPWARDGVRTEIATSSPRGDILYITGDVFEGQDTIEDRQLELEHVHRSVEAIKAPPRPPAVAPPAISNDRLDALVAALDARSNGDHYRARCPHHNGRSANSLSIKRGDNGSLLLHCYPGCEYADVLRVCRGRLGLPAGSDPAAIGTPSDAAPADRRLTTTRAKEIRSERVFWLWPERVPLSGPTVLAGEKGLGKSITSNAWLAARVTRGELDGELKGQSADVLIVTAEDSWASIVKPRLQAHGADLDRVHRIEVTDEHGETTFTLPDDVALLEDEIERLRRLGADVRLLVVDPIGAFLTHTTDSHKDSHVRRALAPLATLADRQGLAILIVAHLTKDESKRLLHRVSGAGAFVNAARSVLAFARDPSDPHGERGSERVLVHVASNWGRHAVSLATRIESRLVEVDDGTMTDTGYIAGFVETDVGVEDLQRTQSDDGGSECEEEVISELAEGERPSLEVKAAVAKTLGVSRKTVERAAMRLRDRGELEVGEGGFPRKTTWELIRPSGDSSGDGQWGHRDKAERVPTAQTALESGAGVPTAPSRDSGDSPLEAVPTGASEGLFDGIDPDPNVGPPASEDTVEQMREAGITPIPEGDRR
jgi:hypothetical protein